MSARRWAGVVAAVVLSLGFGSAARAATTATTALTGLQVFPPEILLRAKQDRQAVVVQATYADGTTRDVTGKVEMHIGNGALARVDRQVVSPLSDGATELKVTWEGRVVRMPITLQQVAAQRPIRFTVDVVPALTKAGCNSGACHGASRGKDGFRLSLFGYDPEGDFLRITREQIGRRINLALPEESLLLEKGLGVVQHTGGERFTKESGLYATVLAWIQAGAPRDATNVEHVVGIDLYPGQAVLEGSNTTQRLVVRARYSDGSLRDVSSQAVFISNNDVCAKVSPDGVITAGQRGEAFVMARFDSFTVGAQVIVVPQDPGFRFPENLARNNYIDELVDAKLRKLRVIPAEVCDDATFARRAYLDVVGLLPSAEEVGQFVAEPSPAKRDHLVEQLLNRPEFADLWVMKWAELLQIRSRADQFSPKAALAYYSWLQERMLNNVPIDKIVRELLTGSGSTLQNPEANYYEVTTDTLKLAENTAQVFLGMRIQCAQCHNHPFDRWTMNDYYSFASFFPQVGRKQGEDPREYIIFDRGDGEVKHPVTGKSLPPKYLGAARASLAPGESRRAALARWLASPENPAFARNLANIVWSHFLGRGIVEPVDDVRISNPASNPELLDKLGAKFTEYEYDFKRLVRDICSSRTYQLSTRANASNEGDERNFAKASIRRLRAEVLLDCLTEVTETKDKFPGLPRGSRAVQIADGNSSTYFLTTFGRASRETVCSCEVKVDPNLSQALHLLNGTTVENKISEGGVVKRMLKSGRKPEEILEALYLRCFARKPTEAELVKLRAFLVDGKPPEPILNDLFWALINAKEFAFNH